MAGRTRVVVAVLEFHLQQQHRSPQIHGAPDELDWGCPPGIEHPRSRATAKTTHTLWRRASNQELLAGFVRVLRIVGPAADEQRPGTRLRQPSRSRAPREWTTSGVARIGGDGLGARDLEYGDPAAPGGRLGLAAGLCAAVAGAASGIGSAARVAT